MREQPNKFEGAMVSAELCWCVGSVSTGRTSGSATRCCSVCGGATRNIIIRSGERGLPSMREWIHNFYVRLASVRSHRKQR